jgi:hypothetical protein
VTEPGRLRFGWVRITAEELAIWRQYPNAAFTLFTPASAIETEERVGEEFDPVGALLIINNALLGRIVGI